MKRTALEEQILEKLEENKNLLSEIKGNNIDTEVYTTILQDYTDEKKQQLEDFTNEIANPLGNKRKTFKTIKFQSMTYGAILFQECFFKNDEITKYGDIYISGYVDPSLMAISGETASVQRLPFPSDVEFDMIYGVEANIYARPKAGQSDVGGIEGSLDNTLFCLGKNNAGQLGKGDTINSLLPYVHTFNSRVVDIQVSCGYESYLRAYALLENKELYGCGNQSSGELGLGDLTQRNSWVMIHHNVEKFFALKGRTFVVADNKIYGTGNNDISGELGVGDNIDKNTWTLVKDNITDMSSVVIKGTSLNESSWHATTLFLIDGILYGCGTNISYQITSANAVNQNSLIRVTMSNGSNLVWTNGSQFLSTPYLTAILLVNGGNMDLYVSGYGRYGFGDGTVTTATKLKKIKTFTGDKWILRGFQESQTASQIGDATFVINTETKEVWSFGYNHKGQLGVGTKETSSTTIKKAFLPKYNEYIEVDIANEQTKEYSSLVCIADNVLFVCGYNTYGRAIRESAILSPNTTF